MRDLIALMLCACLLWFSDAAMSAALTSAQVFVNGVMPALFPMMVLSRLLSPRLHQSEIRTLGEQVMFAFLSGSPAAAQRVSSAPGIPARLWQPLLCATGVMSPMFFTGTLAAWTRNAPMARRMLVIHWLGALITAGLWRMLFPCKGRDAPEETAPESLSLPSAIAQSAMAMLSVLGAMMLFSILCGVLQRGLSLLFPRWVSQNGALLSVLWAVLEIGGGSRAVIEGFPAVPWALLSALCAFGGLSIWLQNLLFLDKSIRPAKLLGMRALHGAVCYGLMRLTLLF